ncbi:MAG: DNA-directed RNA polymerase [Nanoarchaeota archaeon]|nr:DNA-directed RNA polymerase [Nanoarchaeota archaeon]
MFYKTELSDHIRVPPSMFDLSVEEAVVQRVKKKFEGYISKDFGVVIDVSDISEIGEGIIIPCDGAPYYKVKFKLLTYKPEMHEVVLGKIKDIADFGAFINLGPIDGMIHISQTMDDFVSFSKDKVLSGKESRRTIKVNDSCYARIIAVSFKDVQNPKLGLTMRQAGLGKLEWIDEDQKTKTEKEEPKKEPKKEKKGKK